MSARDIARPAALLVLFAGVFIVARASDLSARLSPDELRTALDELGLWAPAGLLAVFLLRPLLLIPITPFWIAAGTLFGWVEGAAWAIVGTCLGAGLGFGLARSLGRDFVERRLGRRLLRWRRLAGGEGLRTILALQLTPIMPHDLINNLAGVSRIAYPSFFLGSLLGTIPIITIYTYIGNAIWDPDSPPFWVAMGLLLALTITMLIWNRRLAGRRQNVRRFDT
ncbi:MAG TPA: VTT domain-containing protein [Gemmatimonadota bacterium]|nr:VTT domain-containing protein [Gemmatimonadota bacterium]